MKKIAEHPEQSMPSTGFLRLPGVLRIYPVSKSTWWAGVRAGRFPQPHKIGARCTAWRIEDIVALIGESSEMKA